MIELKNVWFRYSTNRWVLKNINVRIREGFTAIVGPNGAGKSTLLKLISGFLKPTKGQVYVRGKPINSLNDLVGLVAFVPSTPIVSLIGPTVSMDFQKAVKSFNSKFDTKEIVSKLDITHLLSRKIFHLSEGETRLVSITSAFLLDTPIILLDEPTVGLDKVFRRKLLELINMFSLNKAIIIATNDLRLASRAKNVIFLEDGSIRLAGSPSHVFYNPMFQRSVGISDIVAFCTKVDPIMKINSRSLLTPDQLALVLDKMFGDQQC